MAWSMIPLLLAAAPIPKARLVEARNYVARLYDIRDPSVWDYRHARWSAEISRWLARDGRAAGNEVGAFDDVPFCDCQDEADDYRLLSVSVRAHGKAGARAVAILRNDGVRRFAYDLVLTPDGWRIADIHSAARPSFLAMLRREVRREEMEHRPR